jgi:type II restriction/modification system DNA methylase subunit YeeA
LTDLQGSPLNNYEIEVANDELSVTDLEGFPFTYRPGNKESQRVQEALFHEKQGLIENSLFGVDINPNSVKICRLRLWIELLKNAYYNSEGVLETLPNIDINIKCGNSLISRYALDTNIKKAMKDNGWTMDSYRKAVSSYRNAKSKAEKRDMEELIRKTKQQISSEIRRGDPLKKRYDKLTHEIYNRFTGNFLFDSEGQYGNNPKELSRKSKLEQAEMEKEAGIIASKMNEIRDNKIFQHPLEWRFEFPEILNDDGEFIGFDVVIGNPPYIRQEEFSEIKPFLQSQYGTFAGTADLFVYFVERGMNLLKQRGNFIYILPNKWMRAGYGHKLRSWIGSYVINSITDFGDLPVFEEATTYPCILHIEGSNATDKTFIAANVKTLDFTNGLKNYINSESFRVDQKLLSESGWTLVDGRVQQLLEKIKSKGVPLGEYVNGKLFYGIKTGFNEAFVIDTSTKEQLVAEDPKSEEIIKPFLAGRDIKRYQTPVVEKYLIILKNGDTQKLFGKLEEEPAWSRINETYPAISKHLLQHREKCKKRSDKGQYWWELRACDYYKEIEKKKIVWPETSLDNQFCYVNEGLYLNKTSFFIPVTDHFLIGLLNSKITKFYLDAIVPKMRGGYFSLSKAYVETIRIISEEKIAKIITELVEQILSIKSRTPAADTTVLEAEIDLMVYKLYQLSWDEVKLVDPDFGMSEEEFEKFEA